MSAYRTRNSHIGSSIKNSLSEIMPSKTDDSMERQKFRQSQNASLVKAINQMEVPVKEKHVRNLILGTFHEKNALGYWFNALRLPLYGNQIVCWKFCYTTHKILRDGYPTSVHDSNRYTATLDDLAKSWMHLKQGYYLMIFHYCSYLVYKIKFHKKNEFIPTTLMIEDRDMIDGVGNDINNFFQLCCDLFDYLDEILALQNAIFLTMDRNRSNSMTESGQLKLAPIIILIQESNQLYDFCVKFMFKLHDNLPGDTLEGHRDRFLKNFRELSKFYECCRNLQYFKSLISIPQLPSEPPNFRIKADFNSYQKPIVTVMEEPVETMSVMDDNDVLVDLTNDSLNNSSSSSSLAASNAAVVPSNDLSSMQHQHYIQQLLMEIEKLRAELDRLHHESEFEIRNLRERVRELNDELMATKTELEQERIKSRNLEETIKILHENEKSKSDVENLEKKAVSSEEKFNKMRDLYNKLKNEHVVLLRQDAELKKQKALLAEESEHAKKVKEDCEKRMEQAIAEKSRLETSMQARLNELQQVKTESEKSQADQLSNMHNYEEKIQTLEEQKRSLEISLDECKKSLFKSETRDKENTDKLASYETNLTSLNQELSKQKAELDRLKGQLDEANSLKQLAEQKSQKDLLALYQSLFFNTISNCDDSINKALLLSDDPVLLNCKSGADYLLNQLQPFQNNLNSLLDSYGKFTAQLDKLGNGDIDGESCIRLVNSLNLLASLIGETVVSGKITSLTVTGNGGASEKHGEELSDLCKSAGACSLELLKRMQAAKSSDLGQESRKLNEVMSRIESVLRELLPKVHDINKEEIGDLIELEMQNTSEAIEAAVAKLESLLLKSRNTDTGFKLEVNDKILDNCSNLMKAIKILIAKSKDLQKEIVAQGRVSHRPKNHINNKPIILLN